MKKLVILGILLSLNLFSYENFKCNEQWHKIKIHKGFWKNGFKTWKDYLIKDKKIEYKN